jgi:hypothetical protein
MEASGSGSVTGKGELGEASRALLEWKWQIRWQGRHAAQRSGHRVAGAVSLRALAGGCVCGG